MDPPHLAVPTVTASASSAEQRGHVRRPPYGAEPQLVREAGLMENMQSIGIIILEI